VTVRLSVTVLLVTPAVLLPAPPAAADRPPPAQPRPVGKGVPLMRSFESPPAPRSRPCLQHLAPGLDVLTETTNVGVLRRNGRVLLINSLPPSVLRAAGIRPEQVDWVLITHSHRSAAEGVAELAAAGAKVAVPEAERTLFENPQAFWANDAACRVHCYHFHPSPCTVWEPVSVARGLGDGEAIAWQGLRIQAIATPGPTDGGMSYLVDADGLRVAFIGDLMSSPGKLWEFHRLQGRRVTPGAGEMGEYHGFGERADEVLASLDRVVSAAAQTLVPSHGATMPEPRAAVEALRTNVAACLSNYCSISAARWYFAGVRPEWPADRTYLMSRLHPLPSWVREVGGTTRAVVADDGHVLLMDCDGDLPARIAEQQHSGALGPVDALWITHYHDDHVGSVNALRAEQGCHVIAHESMADILQRPAAYLMPCLNPDPIAVDRITRDGESWEWRGFRLTAYSLPGQSIYDAALLVQKGTETVLFVGDSFGPGGIDDYCAQNRNLLGPGLGFDRCLALLEGLPSGSLLVNPHVEGAFAYTRQDVQAMRHALSERRELFRRLLDWDDPNYGLDPQWVRCDPYRQVAKPGGEVAWDIHIRNYSGSSRTATVTLRLPQSWRVMVAHGAVRVPAGRERSVHLSALVPGDWPDGRVVVGFGLRYGGRPLGEMTEGIVDVATS